MVNNDYMKFRELLDKKQYGEAASYLVENPEVKEMINLDETLSIINYYEEGLRELMVKNLYELGKDMKNLNSELEKTINDPLNKAKKGENN